ALGSQLVGLPYSAGLLRSAPIAARRRGGCLVGPNPSKSPPIYNVLPSCERARARMSPVGSGRQAVSTVLSALMWATLRCATPSTPVNAPAIYQPPAPSGTTAETSPSTCGKAASAVPRGVGSASRTTPGPEGGGRAG